jgi:hypothetical protein
MNIRISALLKSLPLALSLAACGGGGPDPSSDGGQAEPTGGLEADGQAVALGVGASQRAAAATATAQSNGNDCGLVRPFYWEIGDRNGRLVSGTVTTPGVPTTYSATTSMSIASASKWIYGAYVTERLHGVLSDSDRRFLSMRAGYVSLSSCSRGTTVDGCLAEQDNGVYTPEDEGRFKYDGGHMEKHASLIGLGSMNSKTLAAAIQSQIGSEIKIAYSQPQLAGGIVASPDAYASFLRKILAGGLQIGSLLGSGAVCTNPVTCGRDQAIFAPIPPNESWHYSVGHWVEDDPKVGDGAFSSPGAFGFYPWINAEKTNYGIVARVAQNGAFSSVKCGRLIRKAWTTGSAL